jgi:hypothetical protein
MFGRGGSNDADLEAVQLSRVVGRPVLPQWSRTDEFQLSPYPTVLDATISAGLSASGEIVAWRYHSCTNRTPTGRQPGCSGDDLGQRLLGWITAVLMALAVVGMLIPT